MEENAPKVIVPVEEDWPLWKRWLYKFINFSPALVWFLISIYFIAKFNTSLVLTEFRDLYLNTAVASTLYGVLTFIAAVVLLTVCNPWIRPNKIMKEGSDLLKFGLFVYWGLTTLAISIVIWAAN